MNITLTLSHEGLIYELPANFIKSNRRSVGISVKPGGEIIIRAPRLMPSSTVLSYVKEKESWIVRTYLKQNQISPAPAREEKSRQTLALENVTVMQPRTTFRNELNIIIHLPGAIIPKLPFATQKRAGEVVRQTAHYHSVSV